MKSTKNIEKRIKNVNIVIDSERNKKVFSNILQGFEKSKAREFIPTGPNIWRTILKSPITKIATAAVIILTVSFLSTHQNPSKQKHTEITGITKSPVEMMTSISLERAFRRGGIEAVENQCEQALKLLGTRTDGLSSQELLSEFNGS
ncbi:MAG: hypothetical protein ACYS6K_06855 [Planctomycetota bacterium]